MKKGAKICCSLESDFTILTLLYKYFHFHNLSHINYILYFSYLLSLSFSTVLVKFFLLSFLDIWKYNNHYRHEWSRFIKPGLMEKEQIQEPTLNLPPT